MEQNRKSPERISIEEAGLSLEVNKFVLDVANEFLPLLAGEARRRPDWRSVLLETLTDKELEQNREVVEEKLAKWSAHFGIDEPLGAVVGGTGPLRGAPRPRTGRARPRLTGEEAQQAVQILKACGRIVQCGRRRGKCLVVMSDAPLDESILGSILQS